MNKNSNDPDFPVAQVVENCIQPLPTPRGKVSVADIIIITLVMTRYLSPGMGTLMFTCVADNTSHLHYIFDKSNKKDTELLLCTTHCSKDILCNNSSSLQLIHKVCTIPM